MLVENHLLTEEKIWANRENEKGKVNWLERWFWQQEQQADKQKLPRWTLNQRFPLPSGGMLIPWAQERAKKADRQITRQAAPMLVQLIGEEPRQIDQEIHKLLAYVNYQRPVEVDDVMAVTSDVAEGDIFKFVDAIGRKKPKNGNRYAPSLAGRDRSDFNIWYGGEAVPIADYCSGSKRSRLIHSRSFAGRRYSIVSDKKSISSSATVHAACPGGSLPPPVEP